MPKIKFPNISKIKIKKIIPFLGRLPRAFAENAFLTFLSFLIFFSIIAGIIFYNYGILAESRQTGIQAKPLVFQKKIYDDILKVWDDRTKRFQAADAKTYPDLFFATIIATSTPKLTK